MIAVRPITDDEVDAFRGAMLATFGDDADGDPDGNARFRALVAPGHAWAAFDGALVVATAASYALEIGVPGARTLPIAGLTMVSVRPTHRRRGLLRELMARHLERAREDGYAVSGLWASETAIYGRFGYGLAAQHDRLELANAGLRFAERWTEVDVLEPLDEPAARERLPAIYERATRSRPGALRRSAAWWRERRFLEAPFQRRGASRRRHVVARRGDDDVGYIAYRQRPQFDGGLPGGRVEIIELHAIDPRAEATLWKFALSVDLFPNVAWPAAPTDCPLPWMLDDWRRAGRERLDGLWLRLDHVPTALAARGYAHDGRLRISVDGTTYELVVAGGEGRCTITAEPAQVATTAQGLASLYLGGTSASALARADLARGDAAALALADCLFASAVAPWCPEVF